MHSLAALLLAASAAAPFEFRPGITYDPALPTLRQVVGHDWGEEITSPEGISAYLKALAEAAPERARLLTYGRTWEGRPLHVLVVGSSRRLERLDALRADLARLSDPRALAPPEVERLVSELPAVVWLMHAVHGNEISSSDAALLTAYHLLAARGDEALERVRRETLVLIDPLQNPDGRARFLAQFELARGLEPDPEPLSAEHDEPWPGGRTNHYLFDMNRDWFALTQAETRARVAFYLQWFPHVAVDLHEMGGDGTYYFAPPAEPLNPHIAPAQRAWFETFGRAIAGEFDARGVAYFNREVYDSFYPGYGESWPLLQGAIGMTFEQASPRGLLRRRADGTLLSYRDGVRHHFVASLATLEAAALGRARLLRDFVEFRRGAVRSGETGPVREYLLPPGPDPARAARLAELLVEQGIEVRRALEPVRLPGPVARTLPAGTWIVPLAQPAGILARNLLDAHTPLDPDFVREQDRRRRKRLPDQIYDVTGWSLPLAFDVECLAAARETLASSLPLVPGAPAASAALAPARVAYLLPWGVGAARAVIDALGQGLKVRSSGQPFTLAGRRFAAGTAIVRVADNPPDLSARLSELAARHGAEVVPADSGFVEQGASLGSPQVHALERPRVLLAWDAPLGTLSAGAARFVLERRYGLRPTLVRLPALARLDLRRYDVLVLPSGDPGEKLSADALRRVQGFVRDGGTLIALGDSARFLARAAHGLLDTDTELRDGRAEPKGADEKDAEKTPERKGAAPPQPIDLQRAQTPEDERPEVTPGALLRVTLDPEHWLAAGSDGQVQALVDGRRVFSPLKLDKGRNVGVYAEDGTVASGLVWDEARALLQSKAYLMHQPLGEGHVVAFAEDPNFRGFSEATQLLFVNAVLLGPAY